MQEIKIFIIKRIHLYLILSFVLGLTIIAASLFFIFLPRDSTNVFVDPKNGVIVIDPGHGGIDGGTSKAGILEKDINLDISKKLMNLLVKKGYTVIMTRENDISLESLDASGKNRYLRDLNARVNIINKSNAQLFVSIHVNCNNKKPSTDGSIVFYNDKFEQNKDLAYSIQRELNNMIVNGKKRTIHDTVKAKYYILKNSDIPGVLVETAFISNAKERQLLLKESFREDIAEAIASGIEQYLKE
ncbi:MAG TPA: N-acetylmuramoyl-L-alanine amidase [Acetivibrio clariflavus]|nr:N-acetylmuramoyl-L-alanine amidase [Acetivibrio clariflavus]